MARGGVGVGVEEDVAVIEGGEQLRLLAHQQPVAEDVAGHVAHAHHGEGRVLHRTPQRLPEMMVDHHPGSAGGDAHDLVVIALRPARGEGVAEPEAVFLAQTIRDVGEGGGALVGGGHDVGIIPVAADDPRRRRDPRAHVIVGEVQHGADQYLVAGDALGEERLPVRRGRGLLEDEAALRAGGDDDGVLQPLRLHQAQDLGAEILAPVGPADAAACHRPGTEVAALHARGMDEDFPPGTRKRHIPGQRGIQLEGQIGFLLVEIGPQHGVEQAAHPAQDAVLIGVGDAVEHGVPTPDQRGVVTVDQQGVKARREQVEQDARGFRLRRECGRHALLREGEAHLLHPAIHRAQHPAFAPGKAGTQHQPVEAIGLHRAVQQLCQRIQHQRVVILRAGGAGGQREDVQRHRALARDLQAVRHLLDRAQIEALEQRQRVGERQRAAGVHQAQRQGFQRRTRRMLQRGGRTAGGDRRLTKRDVGQRVGRRRRLPVGGREGRAPAREQGGTARLPMFGGERIGDAVAEAARRLCDGAFQRGVIDRRHLARLGADDVVDAGQGRIAKRDVIGRQPPVEAARQHRAHFFAQLGVESVARQPGDGRDEALERVAPDNDRSTGPDLQVQRAVRAVQDLRIGGLEQLVARPGVEDVAQRAPIMALRIHTGQGQDAFHLFGQERDRARVAVVGRGREQPQEQPHANHAPIRAEASHGDHIGVLRAMHRGAHVGLHHRDRGVVQDGRAHGGRHRIEVAQRIEDRYGEVAQQADGLALHQRQSPIGCDSQLPVAQEHEIILGEPAQEGPRRAVRRDLRAGIRKVLQHGREIAHGAAQVAQRAAQRGLQRIHVAIAGMAERHVHHAFARRRGFQRHQPPGLAADADDGVQEAFHRTALQRHRGKDAVHEERHVVGDDECHRARPAPRARCQDAQPRLPGLAVEREGEQMRRRLGDLLGRQAGQFRGRNGGVEPFHQGARGRRQVGGQALKGGAARGQHLHTRGILHRVAAVFGHCRFLG